MVDVEYCVVVVEYDCYVCLCFDFGWGECWVVGDVDFLCGIVFEDDFEVECGDVVC